MSIINQEDLQIAKALQRKAEEINSYEKGYRYAMEALAKTISIIGSVELLTKDIEIKVTIKGE